MTRECINSSSHTALLQGCTVCDCGSAPHTLPGSAQMCHRSLQVNKLEITADKQLLAAAGNPAVKIFEVAAAAPQPIHSFDGHTGNVTGMHPV